LFLTFRGLGCKVWMIFKTGSGFSESDSQEVNSLRSEENQRHWKQNRVLNWCFKNTYFKCKNQKGGRELLLTVPIQRSKYILLVVLAITTTPLKVYVLADQIMVSSGWPFVLLY
jgi:hypothetical protein